MGRQAHFLAEVVFLVRHAEHLDRGGGVESAMLGDAGQGGTAHQMTCRDIVAMILPIDMKVRSVLRWLDIKEGLEGTLAVSHNLKNNCANVGVMFWPPTYV